MMRFEKEADKASGPGQRLLRSRWFWVGVLTVTALSWAVLVAASEPSIPGKAKPRISVTPDAARPSDVLEFRIEATEAYTWGVKTSLQASRTGAWKTVAYWRTWPGKDLDALEPFQARDLQIFQMVGFSGDASFQIRVPDMKPGRYRITKSFTLDGPASSAGRSVMTYAELRIIP